LQLQLFVKKLLWYSLISPVLYVPVNESEVIGRYRLAAELSVVKVILKALAFPSDLVERLNSQSYALAQ